MSNASKTSLEPMLVGIDWADQKHDVCVRLPIGTTKSFKINADTDDVEQLIAELARLADGRPVAICLEKSRVRIIYHLMLRENIQLFLVDPKQLARYRESFSSGGAKDDIRDAALLLRLLRERRDELRVFEPDDKLTRLVGQLGHTRRSLVDDRTRLLQQLQSKLKTYNPLPLSLASGNAKSGLLREIVRRWPDPRKFQRVHPQTLRKLLRRHGLKDAQQIEQQLETIRSKPLVTRDAALIEPLAIQVKAILKQIQTLDEAIGELEKALKSAMQQHPDAELFTALPGAGEALAPRLLAAFGSQRDRYRNADEIGQYSGILPVTKQSGNTKHVSRRRACPKFLRQTFHEFAAGAKQWCTWSKAYYQWLTQEKKMRHHAALRKLASRWIRILFRVWHNRTPYDPNRYLQCLHAKNHPCLKFLEKNNQCH